MVLGGTSRRCVLSDAVRTTGSLERRVALVAGKVHTSIMTLKNAALPALIGTLLLTILVAADFIKTVSGVLDGLVPAMALLRSLIYLLASLGVTVFFWLFSKTHDR